MIAAGQDGWVERVRRWLFALVTLLEARWQLAGLEAREAGRDLLVAVVLIGAALLAAALAYIFILGAAVWLLGWLLGGGLAYLAVAAGAGVFHAGAAVFCALSARDRLKQPFFPATMEEFRHDREWLRSQQPTTQP